jgi:hypothetical protein
MPTQRTLHDLEISQTPDQLVIRGRKLAVVASVAAVVLLVPFSLSIAYTGIMGNAQFPAIWNRPPGDRVAVSLIMLVMDLPFAIVPIALCAMFTRRRRRPWAFDRRQGQLTRLTQSWPLAGLTDVAVEVGKWNNFASVVLHFQNLDPLEIARFPSGKNVTIHSRVVLAGSLASTIGDFLQVPVRHPTPRGRGFEVVTPIRPR